MILSAPITDNILTLIQLLIICRLTHFIPLVEDGPHSILRCSKILRVTKLPLQCHPSVSSISNGITVVPLVLANHGASAGLCGAR